MPKFTGFPDFHGVSHQDLLTAIQCLRTHWDMTQREVAEGIKMNRNYFSAKLNSYNFAKSLNAEDQARLQELMLFEAPVKTHSVKTIRLLPHDVRALQKLFGKLAGYEEGFSSAETMVHYAQQVAPDEAWLHHTYHSEEFIRDFQDALPKLPQYRLAAMEVVKQMNLSRNDLAKRADISIGDINTMFKPGLSMMSDKTKFAALTALADHLVGHLPPRTDCDKNSLEQMLDAALLTNPDIADIPLAKASSRRGR